MPTFILHHRHAADECRIAFAAWRGFESDLRHHGALASCANGGHALWWTVDAVDADDALSRLPAYLAERTEVSEVSEVPIP